MKLVKIKLDNGFEFKVSENIFLTWKFARLVGDVENSPTPSTVTNFLKYVLGGKLDDLENYLEKSLKHEVLMEDMSQVINEIVEKLGENENIKKQ